MIAKTPPMGWTSWDCYGAAVTEEQVLQNARYMAEHLKPYGWEYVVVDIQWSSPAAINHDYIPFSDLCMDEFGRLIPAENRFPSAAGGKGFAPLVEEIHRMGLKFGIHIMRGMPREAARRHLPIEGSSACCHEVANPNSICFWNPDMYGLKCDLPGAQDYYDSIFRLYASWGVDFVKCDDIAREYPHCQREIELISLARTHSGRDMVLSLSPGPAPLEKAEHLKTWANMWRITDDFWDNWTQLRAMFERAEKWCIHAGPGHWPDADMLPVGALRQCEDPESWTGFTQAEQRTMMSLWCMMRAPLMIGGEMTKNDDFTLKLLTNGALLEIEKESWSGHPVRTSEEECVWVAPRKDGHGCYVALFNLTEKTRALKFDLSEVEQEGPRNAREVWTGQECQGVTALQVKLSPHDAAVFRVD